MGKDRCLCGFLSFSHAPDSVRDLVSMGRDEEGFSLTLPVYSCTQVYKPDIHTAITTSLFFSSPSFSFLLLCFLLFCLLCFSEDGCSDFWFYSTTDLRFKEKWRFSGQGIRKRVHALEENYIVWEKSHREYHANLVVNWIWAHSKQQIKVVEMVETMACVSDCLPKLQRSTTAKSEWGWNHCWEGQNETL